MNEKKPQIPITAHLPEAWKPRHRDDLVRLGSKHDGGYVVTETAILNTDLLIGLGMENNWTFEQDFHERAGCAVHCYDHTVGFPQLIGAAARHFKTALRRPRALDIHQIFFPLKYRRFFSGNKKHFMEKVGNDPESSSDFRKIFSRVPQSYRVFIKMDIEGGEDQVLSGLGDYFPRITGLIIEFHFLIFLHDRIAKHIGEIKRYFDIVHLHANNFKGVDERGLPDVIEITFENKDLRSGHERESERDYPVEGLDYPNNFGLDDYKLLFDREIPKHSD